MAKAQRIGRNSIIKQASLAGSVSDDVPLPEGVILRSEDEMIIWRQFTRARAAGDWRDFDLILLADIVRLEADKRKYQLEVDASGPMVINNRGTQIVNPLIAVIDTLQRQKLAIIRSLSICQQPQDARTLNASGKAQADFRRTLEQNDGLIPGING